MNIEPIAVLWGADVLPMVELHNGNVTDRWLLVKDFQGNIRQFKITIHETQGIVDCKLISVNDKQVCPQCGQVLPEGGKNGL